MNRILLVEDEKWVRASIRKIVEKAGMPFQVVHETSNGIEAADWLREHEVELILSDIRMPAMDGIALLKEVKQKKPDTELILISGHDDFTYAQQGLKYGAFDYLLKPVETEHLAECFKRWQEKCEQRDCPPLEENTPKWEELSPVEQVVQYMQAHPGCDLTLSQAAEMVHLNSSYFCKLFKQQTGINFRDYAIQLRMKEAVRLLENTSLRVSEIAERVGYHELAYFSNTFKKLTGQTPRTYRNKQAE